MPNYYNPYNYQYPYTGYQMNQQPQQSYASNIEVMKWIEGEVGAKAFQMPIGWPANTPYPLWDSTEKKIYLKSWNQMGMANPLTELDYEIKEHQNQPMLPEGVSGKEMPQYATKQDFEELRQEIKNLASSMNTKNRGNQQ